MKFESLALCEPLLRSLKAAGYQEATPIQQQAIPKLLAGHDLIGCAQTGTGKTAAFTLPTLQRLMPAASIAKDVTPPRSGRAIRALILTPTRELAAQIGGSLATYGKYTNVQHTVIFGGVGQQPQVRALKAGIDVLVATPGRLLDLIQQGFIKLSAVEVLILDEADQMLDMGFIHDLKRIVALVPNHRQTLMFSATMPKPIRDLAKQWLRRPFEVKVTPVASTPDRVSQSVCLVERQDKPAVLTRFLNETRRSRTLVFARTKRGADKIARGLQRDGIRAVSIHGGKSQSKRGAAIREFNSQRPPVLVATDLASRGLDFSGVSHVINYDIPESPETYVHRIGRTARAGATGRAVSFCGRDERQYLRMIERLIGKAIAAEELGCTAGESVSRAAPPKNAANADADSQATSQRCLKAPAERQFRRSNSRTRPSASKNTATPRPQKKSRRRRAVVS
ncbi:MAG: DEAD/DEAH box helicase [Planctomycetaceae bacterium]|nr:DEAD/DEAH box helicase [Planctomycetales bacterium]MCB9927540.1 DEAD/DEAH box helicase [Planctomycetaceae bacterium]